MNYPKGGLDSLPEQLARRRMLPLKSAADFLGVSVPTLRKMYRNGTLPRPAPLNERSLGYSLGVLSDWIDARQHPQIAA